MSWRAHAIDLIVYFPLFERGAEGWWDGAGNAEAFVTVIENMEESEGGVFSDDFVGVGVDEVPGAADVGVWDVEAGVEGFKGVERKGAGAGFVGCVDRVVL